MNREPAVTSSGWWHCPRDPHFVLSFIILIPIFLLFVLIAIYLEGSRDRKCDSNLDTTRHCRGQSDHHGAQPDARRV